MTWFCGRNRIRLQLSMGRSTGTRTTKLDDGVILRRCERKLLAMLSGLTNVLGQFTLTAFVEEVVEERPFRLWLHLQNRLVSSQRTLQCRCVDRQVIFGLLRIRNDEGRTGRSHLHENLVCIVLV